MWRSLPRGGPDNTALVLLEIVPPMLSHPRPQPCPPGDPAHYRRLVSVTESGPQTRDDSTPIQQFEEIGMEIQLPEPLRIEHEEMMESLQQRAALESLVGEKVRVIIDMIVPHMEREEMMVLKPLALLDQVALGKQVDTSGIEDAVALKKSLPVMYAEHREISRALGRLAEAARVEKDSDTALIAEKIMMHIRLEEEILYPAAIILSEYLEIRNGAELVAPV